MYELNALPIMYIGDARVAFQRIRVNLRDILLATAEDGKTEQEVRMAKTARI